MHYTKSPEIDHACASMARLYMLRRGPFLARLVFSNEKVWMWTVYEWFRSPKVLTLMKHLSPALLRFGGSSSDWLFFDRPQNVIDSLRLKPKANVMTSERRL